MTQLTLPVQPEEATRMLLKKLPTKRMRAVVEKRFGLHGGRKKTLEAIGKEYKITRERVRQIEADALKHLAKPENYQEIEPTLRALEDHFRAWGGVLAEHHFFDMVGNSRQVPHLCLFLKIGKDFSELPETNRLHRRWTIDKSAADRAEKIVERTRTHLAERGRSLSRRELHAVAVKYSEEILGKELPKEMQEAHLGISKEIRQNPYGEYGLISWPTINPRGVKDKAYLVFSKTQKPLHFREVAEAINSTSWPARQRPEPRPQTARASATGGQAHLPASSREASRAGATTGGTRHKAHPQTVHNELIKDPRFVLVGRGLYALKEWGYEPGTVKEILVSVFKQAGRPLKKDEAIKMVLKKRFVKPPTVLLNLQDKSLFKRINDEYTLV